MAIQKKDDQSLCSDFETIGTLETMGNDEERQLRRLVHEVRCLMANGPPSQRLALMALAVDVEDLAHRFALYRDEIAARIKQTGVRTKAAVAYSKVLQAS